MDVEKMQDYLVGRISVDANGCFNWLGSKNLKGYGTLSFNGKNVKAYRMSYAVFRREIPVGLSVCHHCDNRACINPSHLFLGTQKDNMADAARKHRMSHGGRHSRIGLTEQRVLDMIAAYKSGMETTEVANKFGVNSRVVRSILKGDRWKYLDRERVQLRKPKHCGSRKLNEEMVREIRKARDSGESLNEISARFGVTFSNISYVCSGKTWKHVQ